MASASCYGGPADGVTFTLARLPKILRVTRNAEKFDALDLLDDEPYEDEIVCVYRMWGGVGFMCPAPDGDPRSAGYEHVPAVGLQPGESMREREGWHLMARRLAVDLSDQPGDATWELLRERAEFNTTEED